MYILNEAKTKLYDMTCMSHVFVNEKEDAVLICGAFYRVDIPAPITLGRYWSKQMAKDVLNDLCMALKRDEVIFEMPAVADMEKRHRVLDARIARHGGS
jgi:hypothetical protein